MVQTLQGGEFAPQQYIVEVQMAYMAADVEPLRFPIMELSYHEQNRILLHFPDPDPPMKNEGGKVVKKWDDSEYLEAKGKAQEMRWWAIVASSLIGAGNFPQVKEQSLEKQIEYLQGELAYNVVVAIRRALGKAVIGGQVQIMTLADTFLGLSDDAIPRDEDVSANGAAMVAAE